LVDCLGCLVVFYCVSFVTQNKEEPKCREEYSIRLSNEAANPAQDDHFLFANSFAERDGEDEELSAAGKLFESFVCVLGIDLLLWLGGVGKLRADLRDIVVDQIVCVGADGAHSVDSLIFGVLRGDHVFFGSKERLFDNEKEHASTEQANNGHDHKSIVSIHVFGNVKEDSHREDLTKDETDSYQSGTFAERIALYVICQQWTADRWHSCYCDSATDKEEVWPDNR
jgi:hypothetical protein